MNAASKKRRKPAPRPRPKATTSKSSGSRGQRPRGRSAKSLGTPVYVAIAALALGAVALVVVLSSGSDDIADPNVAATDIEFVGTDFAFAPVKLTGLSGQLGLTLVNDGPGVHNLAVLKEGIEIAAFAEHTDDMDLAFIPLTSPDDSASTSVQIEAGTYQVVCLIPGHLAAGMKAELVVTDSPPPNSGS